MNYLDLFSGIGGFALGFQRAGWKFDKHYFSEIDKNATAIYKRHFPEAVELGSITGVRPEGLGKIDLITFGFPCQDLSIAGKRAGLGGSRSGLFFEAMRLIRFLRPSIFIFENVKGLLTSNRGQDFEIVLREIADIGLYECEWQLLNTSWFLPQNRERIYFIGHLGERGGRKVFPIGEMFQQNDGASKGPGENIACSLGCRSAKSRQGCDYSLVAIPTLTPHREEKRQNGRRFKENGEDSFTLTAQDIHGVSNGETIRDLTPTEYARLQGFPDDWCDRISDAQKYRCFGNAVSVPVVQCIAERLK